MGSEREQCSRKRRVRINTASWPPLTRGWQVGKLAVVSLEAGFIAPWVGDTGGGLKERKYRQRSATRIRRCVWIVAREWAGRYAEVEDGDTDRGVEKR
jgi:hypothetical protein